MATIYVWDPIEDNVIRERDENGNTIVNYTTEPTRYGAVLSQDRGGQVRHYHYDGQGNTVSLTDNSGNVTDTRKYSAFGEVTESTGTTVMPFQYCGKVGYYRDTESGGYYVRRRIYNSLVERWICEDPSVHSEIGLYIYARNNPIAFLDPSGLIPVFGGDECEGTDCDEKAGIKTWVNPKAAKDCAHECKNPIVNSHEGTHRKNMKDCCDRLVKCIAIASEPGANPNYIKLCRTYWETYKKVNRLSLEQRAAAVSCEFSKDLFKTKGCAKCPPPPKLEECCKIIASEREHLCKNADANAKLQCCPFDGDGEPDPNCYRKLKSFLVPKDPPKDPNNPKK